jgi:carbamoyl-phosphate synthase large subunit
VIIGAGPIVIGQACEFDYSGTQGAKALREEGYEVVLVNSNPATIMTDPELATRTYIEPLEPRTLAAIIERERPHAILPTLGGQTALNLALKLHERGCSRASASRCSARARVDRQGRGPRALQGGDGEDRPRVPALGAAHSVEEARAIVTGHGLPASCARPSRSADRAGGIAQDASELDAKVAWALAQSPTREVLIEESVLGWKEFELEVMRDRRTTSSSSARSRTSTRWGCTRATRSPSPRDDADRPRVPAPPRRGARRHDRDRRRDGRRERAVRREPRRTGASTSSR